MSYRVMAIRSREQVDTRLFPRVNADASGVMLHDTDGQVLRLPAHAISVIEVGADGRHTLLGVRGIGLELTISESRFIVAATDFAQPRSWWGRGGGGVAYALTANAGCGHVEGAHRRGEMLVGHVRYESLAEIGYKPKTGWRSDEEVRLGVFAVGRVGTRRLYVQVALPPYVDSAGVARATVRRAAKYRLGGVAPVAGYETLQALTRGATLDPPVRRRFASYRLPGAIAVCDDRGPCAECEGAVRD